MTHDSFGGTIGATFADALGRIIDFLPHLIAGVLILAVGLLIAWGLGTLTRKALARAGFDRFLRRHEMVRGTTESHGSRTAGAVVFWVVTLASLVAAADALSLPWISTGLARITAYLPNVLAAGLIVLGAWLVGNVVYRARVRARPGATRYTAQIVRSGIWVLAGFMAIQELHIAVGIVTLCFGLLVGAIAVATALAFGLGSREVAGRMVRDWYDRNRVAHEEEPSELRPPLSESDYAPPIEPRH